MNVCAITPSQISQTDTGGVEGGDGDYGSKIDGGGTEAEGERKRRSRYTVTQILLLLPLQATPPGGAAENHHQGEDAH